jgi:F-type H+-transporting ATPase subunit epsilon
VAKTFHLSVLTPDRSVYEGAVEYLEAPGTEGNFGVLVDHAALVTGLRSGTLTLREAGGATTRLELSGGFFEISNNQATVLADAVTESHLPKR